MTDERGGRYFREARFFLAGDKIAAQSHTPEARSLMGYMRDMQTLGGPPIQVQYATLQDGTRIKATMMNGQYQAEIVSPAPKRKNVEKQRVLTIVGQKYTSQTVGGQYTYQAFKWQKATGVVVLPLPPGRNFAYAYQASDDGSVVLGRTGNYVWTGSTTVVTDWGFVVWDSENAVALLPAVPTYHHIYDVQFNDLNYFDALPAIAPSMWSITSVGVQNRYPPGLKRLLYSAVQGAVDHVYAATVDVSLQDVESFGLLESDPAPTTWTYSMVQDVDDSGDVLAGVYDTDLTPPPVAIGGRTVAVWQRPGLGQPYVRSIPNAALYGEARISGDGATVGGLVAQVRTALPPGWNDWVPAVYTSQYGLEQLEPFYVGPGSTGLLQSVGLSSIAYDGNTACGSEEVSGGSSRQWVKAWQRDELGVWGPLPELDYTFYGVCWHAN